MKIIKLCTLSFVIIFGLFTASLVTKAQVMNCVPGTELCAAVSNVSVTPSSYEEGSNTYPTLRATYFWSNNTYNTSLRMDLFKNGVYVYTPLSVTRTQADGQTDEETLTAQINRDLSAGTYTVRFSVEAKESPSGRAAYDEELVLFVVNIDPDEDADIMVYGRDLQGAAVPGGSWEIVGANPQDGTGSQSGPHQVVVSSGGTTYLIEVTSEPTGYNLYGISNSDGGKNALLMFPNNDYPDNHKSFYVTWQKEVGPTPQCKDGNDNDGDGKVDMVDPGCENQDDDDETNVAPPPGVVDASITASPMSLSGSGQTILAWESQNAVSCNSSWAGAKSPNGNGTQTVTVSVTTTYTIICTGSDSRTDQDSVTVTVTSSPSSYQCSDSIDNDGDGDVDMNDPGCASTTDNDEYNEVSGPILRVSIVGTGLVTSTTAGVSCPNDCRQSYSNGTKVTLNATETGGEMNQFLGWSGACTGTGSCQVNMTGRFVDVTAKFGEELTESTPLRATVVGEGLMTSSPSGISCTADADNSDCRQNYPQGTVVTLTADPDSGQVFSGWSGEACSGSTNLTCQATVGGRFFDVTATFGGADSTIRVRSNATANWIINPGEHSGSTPAGAFRGVVVVPSPAGTLYTITPQQLNGYGTPTVTNTKTGAGSSMMIFPDEGEYFTLNYPSPFNYTLTNSGTVTVRKAGIPQYGQGTVTKNLTSGTAQNIDLTLSGVPSGVSYTSANNPCPPNCTSTITFTVQPSAPAGTHPITVTGSPLGKTTQFNLVIQESPDIVVSCTADPVAPLVGQSVTWTANVSGGGVPPYTYSWTGTNLPVPAPTTQSFNVTYSTVGQKTVQATVRDSLENTGTCSPGGSLYVDFDPSFEEF